MVTNSNVPCLIDSIAQNLYWVLHSCFGSQNNQCLLWMAQPTIVRHCTLPSARQFTIHQPIFSRSILVSTHSLLHAVCICHLPYSLHATYTAYLILHLSPQWGFVQYKLSTAMLCNFFQRSVMSSLVGIKIRFNTLF